LLSGEPELAFGSPLPSSFPRALGFRRGGKHRRGEPFIKAKEVLDPLAVARKRLLAVQTVDGLVEGAVRLAEILWHDIGIIEIGECRALMRRQMCKNQADRAKTRSQFPDGFAEDNFSRIFALYEATGLDIRARFESTRSFHTVCKKIARQRKPLFTYRNLYCFQLIHAALAI
jgi:hypothetical protein